MSGALRRPVHVYWTNGCSVSRAILFSPCGCRDYTRYIVQKSRGAPLPAFVRPPCLHWNFPRYRSTFYAQRWQTTDLGAFITNLSKGVFFSIELYGFFFFIWIYCNLLRYVFKFVYWFMVRRSFEIIYCRLIFTFTIIKISYITFSSDMSVIKFALVIVYLLITRNLIGQSVKFFGDKNKKCPYNISE